ncbi:hypothetical protein Z046_00465 [Pseudomonas aeruginosa VRFPA09]|nr:hypothetical protein Z046_00465 [Pseudomonas aeruginosa VRFPA09]
MSEGNHSRSRLLPSLLGLLILLSGLALLAGGIKLASLGGSLYYLLAGIGLALSGLLLLLGKRAALGLYALVLFASTVWALWEVGLDWWQLVPRLALWFVFGLLLWLPWFRRPLLAEGPAPLGRAEARPAQRRAPAPRGLPRRRSGAAPAACRGNPP